MNTADLISSYLNNEMSPDQERQFLLSVAASDQLRLALKSHVMLDRVILRQAQETQVPPGVRSAILAQASTALSVPTNPGRGHVAEGAASRFSGGSITNGVIALGIAVSLFAGGYFTRAGMESPSTPVVAVEIAGRPLAAAEPSVESPLIAATDVRLIPAAAVAGVGVFAGTDERSNAAGVSSADRSARSSIEPARLGPVRIVSREDLRKSRVVKATDNPLNASTDVFKELKSSQIASPESTGSASHGLQPLNSKTVDVETSIHSSQGASDGGGRNQATP